MNGEVNPKATPAQIWPQAGFDLVSLRIVLAAAEKQSFAGAAQRENTSLSAVSRRVAELEQRVGISLFHRHDRGVTPTEAGASFVAQLYDLFESLESIAVELDQIRKGTRGFVRVSAPLTIVSGDLPAKIADFIAQHPAIEVQMVEETSGAAMHGVSVGDIDLALVPGSLQHGGLSFIPWLDEELVAVLPKGHRLVRKKAIKLVDLADEPFIGMQRDSALLSLCRQKMSAAGHKLKERAHTTSIETVRQLVSAGLGVGILPAAAVYPYASLLKLVALTLDESWAKFPIVLCAREPERRTAATKLLIAHLVPAPG